MVRRALDNNPYAADLHANMMILASRENDTVAAQAEFAILKRLVPRSAVVQTLVQAGFQ